MAIEAGIARLNLSQIARSASMSEALGRSREFLTSPSGLPARFQHFTQHVQSSPLCHAPAVQRLLTNTATLQQHIRAGSDIDLKLSEYRQSMEADVDGVVFELQQGRQRNTHSRLDVNTVLDHTFRHLLTTRVLLDEHLHKVDRTDPQIKWFDALKLAEDSVEQIKAFSIEKNGACPDIEIRSAIPASASAATQTSSSAHDSQQLLGHPAHLHFMLIELLKNSCRAVLDRFGVLQAHSAPPIVLTVAANQAELVIRVSDQGGGLTHKPVDYFASTAPAQLLTYTYSRQFGQPFTGFGVGLGVTRLLCSTLYGGSVQLESMPQHGTDAYLRLQRRGNVMF